MSELANRLDYLVERLRGSYEGIGHSSGRPYVYFVYAPDREQEVRRLVDESLRDGDTLCYHHLDLLPLTIDSMRGQEERREALLNDPMKGSGAATSILRLWARRLSQEIASRLTSSACRDRPVVVLRGLAALHPLGNPTGLMEALAEQEPRDPQSHQIVPIVLLIPGVRPPQSSRTYLFLGLSNQRLDFYRGEEI